MQREALVMPKLVESLECAVIIGVWFFFSSFPSLFFFLPSFHVSLSCLTSEL